MFFTLIAIFIGLIIFFIKYNYSYWTRLGIPQDENNKPFIGCLTQVVKGETNPGGCLFNIYFNTKGDFVGIYMLYRPALLIRNVELARNILISNFSNFHDRGVYNGFNSDPLYSNLFSQKGNEWKSMRQKLSPSFTSGKIKGIFHISNEVGTKMTDYVNNKIGDQNQRELDVREIFTIYAIDIIASAVFGLDINGFKNKRHAFTSVVEEFGKFSLRNVIFTTCSFLFPKVYWYISKIGFGTKSIELMKSIMKESIEMRKKNGVVRKDILQLLMQLQVQGQINENDDWTIKSNTSNKAFEHFSLDNLTAESYVFYIAGQETTAATASFTVAELAMHPQILKKAQKDVDDVMAKHNGVFSYEALQEMEYLELCMKESLRKYPGLPMLNRECNQDFKIPGTDKIIKKGTAIILPIMAYQRDSANFPDPEEYDPDRFLSSNSNLNAYMPFGEGPRICIAARLGKINSKLAVAKLLYSFNIEPMPKRKFEIEPQAPTLMPRGGVHVKLSKRQKNENLCT